MFTLFAAAGADRIMTVDLHAAQEQGFFNGPVDHLTALPVLLDYMRSRLPLDNTTIVSPDAGRIKVSEQWAAKLGGLPLADRIMTVDPHAAQEQGFYNGPGDHLTALPVLLDYMRSRLPLDNTTSVSPDAGRIKVSEQWAAKLGGLPLAFINKTSDTTRPNQAVAHGIIGDVKGRDCVVIDDMNDTAGTITEAGRTLHEHGAKSVTLVATHGGHHHRSGAHTARARRQVGHARRHARPALRPGR